jgi:hypothetical protein
MEDIGIFYAHVVYFAAICYILWTLDIFYGYLVIFPILVVYCIKKNLATLLKTNPICEETFVF